MTDLESDANERIDSRTERALTQYLTVLDDVGRAKGADDLFLVVSQSGNEYLVDARTGACECPDHEYRGIHCKHAQRVEFATGERPIPATVDAVDTQLGEHVNAGPRAAATNGGIVVANDDGEILDESENDDGRPEDCQCWDAGLTLPCFPCYREEFEEPNPETPGADDGAESDDTPRRHEPADFGGGESTGVQEL